MKKNYYLIIAILVLFAIAISVFNTRSAKKRELALQEDVARMQHELEPKLEKLMELKSNLKEEINKLRENSKNLAGESVKEAHGQKESAKEKVHELKQVAQAKKDVLQKHAGQIQDTAVQAVLERYDHAITELEELEAEMSSWKENFQTTLKEKKAKATKEMHQKLEAARDKLQDINDRIGKAIEKAGQTMQSHD
jgi:DNA repair exonuclease SbcCD ATPase subunit